MIACAPASQSVDTRDGPLRRPHPMQRDPFLDPLVFASRRLVEVGNAICWRWRTKVRPPRAAECRTFRTPRCRHAIRGAVRGGLHGTHQRTHSGWRCADGAGFETAPTTATLLLHRAPPLSMLGSAHKVQCLRPAAWGPWGNHFGGSLVVRRTR